MPAGGGAHAKVDRLTGVGGLARGNCGGADGSPAARLHEPVRRTAARRVGLALPVVALALAERRLRRRPDAPRESVAGVSVGRSRRQADRKQSARLPQRPAGQARLLLGAARQDNLALVERDRRGGLGVQVRNELCDAPSLHRFLRAPQDRLPRRRGGRSAVVRAVESGFRAGTRHRYSDSAAGIGAAADSRNMRGSRGSAFACGCIGNRWASGSKRRLPNTRRGAFAA